MQRPAALYAGRLPKVGLRLRLSERSPRGEQALAARRLGVAFGAGRGEAMGNDHSERGELAAFRSNVNGNGFEESRRESHTGLFKMEAWPIRRAMIVIVQPQQRGLLE